MGTKTLSDVSKEISSRKYLWQERAYSLEALVKFLISRTVVYRQDGAVNTS
jgi:hypothetical protein